TNLVSFTFSPDMRWLLMTDVKGRLGVWDMPGQQLITNFVAHPSPAVLGRSVFLSGATRLLTYGTENLFKEWDIATWKETRRWPMDVDKVFWAVSPAAGLIAAANGNGWFELITTRGPEERSYFKGQDRLIGIDLSPDGKTLAAASENGTVELWDTETKTRMALLHGVLLGYHSVAISPDGERVAAGRNG